jgi:thioredoxin reductase
VALVGAGNSAGQAAVYLASQVRKVWMIARGGSLEATMSRYLIERIESAAQHRGLVEGAKSSALDGHDEPGQLSAGGTAIEGRETRARRSATCSCSSAPTPNTDWLAHCDVELDNHGFVRTGTDLVPRIRAGDQPQRRVRDRRRARRLGQARRRRRRRRRAGGGGHARLSRADGRHAVARTP